MEKFLRSLAAARKCVQASHSPPSTHRFLLFHFASFTHSLSHSLMRN